MKKNSLSITNGFIVLAFAFLTLLISAQNSFAVIDRIRSTSLDFDETENCNVDDKSNQNSYCKTSKISFNPFSNNSDILWEIDNPVCISYVAASGVAIKIASMIANNDCGNVAKDVADSVASGVPLSPLVYISQMTNLGLCATSAPPLKFSCCIAVATQTATIGAAVAALAIIWQTAVDSQQNAHICGEKWLTWQERDAAQSDTTDIEGIANYVSGSLPDDKMFVYGKKDNSCQVELEEDSPSFNMKDKNWREYFYGGIEYEDNSGDAFSESKRLWKISEQATQERIDATNSLTKCLFTNLGITISTFDLTYLTNTEFNSCTDEQNTLKEKVTASDEAYKNANDQIGDDIGNDLVNEATSSEGCSLPNWSGDKLEAILGYRSGKQRYYMRGPKQAANYACGRFLLNKNNSTEDIENGKLAYACCKKRSQETICIEESNAINNVGGTITPATNTKHKFCKLGERCKVQNVWYQIHSAKSVSNYLCASTYSVCPYNHNLGGGTEVANYSSNHPDILLNHCQYLKHCVKIPDVPYIKVSDLDGAWISSACYDMKGDSQNQYEFNGYLTPINNTRNFSAPIAQCFKETLENIFTNIAGHTVCLDPDEEPDEDDVCESGNYSYRAGYEITSQKSFFQNIQSGLQSSIKAVMTVAVLILGMTILLTGQGPDKKTILMFLVKLSLVTYFALGTAWQDKFFSGVSGTSMYLANIFLKLDESKSAKYLDGCQFPKYNYAVTDSLTKYNNPSYPIGKEYLTIWDMLDCKIIRALGFGPEVSVPNLFMMILAGFLTNGLGIIFFLATFIFAFYLIALTIRALHIFLISSTAIILMVYVSPITITACLFKRTEGIFKNWRTQLLSFVIQPVILFTYLGILITVFEGTMLGSATFSGDGLDNPKEIVCNSTAKNDSIYCIFNIAKIKTNNTLAPIGIGLPTLFDMNSKKLNTVLKAAFLLFIFTQFLDKITGFAARLTSGAELGSKSKSAMQGMMMAQGALSAIQKRGKNAIQKWGGKAAGGAYNKTKKSVRAIQGKDTRPDGISDKQTKSSNGSNDNLSG